MKTHIKHPKIFSLVLLLALTFSLSSQTYELKQVSYEAWRTNFIELAETSQELVKADSLEMTDFFDRFDLKIQASGRGFLKDSLLFSKDSVLSDKYRIYKEQPQNGDTLNSSFYSTYSVSSMSEMNDNRKAFFFLVKETKEKVYFFSIHTAVSDGKGGVFDQQNCFVFSVKED